MDGPVGPIIKEAEVQSVHCGDDDSEDLVGIVTWMDDLDESCPHHFTLCVPIGTYKLRDKLKITISKDLERDHDPAEPVSQYQ